MNLDHAHYTKYYIEQNILRYEPAADKTTFFTLYYKCEYVK